MIRFWLTCIYLFVAFSINAQIDYAESIYETGNYELAAVEFERAIYLSADQSEKNKAILGKVNSLKQQQRFKEAYYTTLRGNTYSPDSTINGQIRYESILTAYLGELYNDGYNQFKQLKYFHKNQLVTDRARIIAVLCLNELGRWDEAAEILTFINRKYELKIDLTEIYDSRKYPKIRDLEKQQFGLALFPSFILLREGELVSGLGSMLLKGMVLSYNVYHLINGYYLNALLAGGAYALLYAGSTSNASDALIINNNRKLQKYNTLLRQRILESIENGSNQLSLNNI